MSKPERSRWCAIHRVSADQCKQCDKEPYITRFFVGAVSIKHDESIEGEPSEADWKEFEKELIKAIRQPHSSPYQIYFDEWDADTINLIED